MPKSQSQCEIGREGEKDARISASSLKIVQHLPFLKGFLLFCSSSCSLIIDKFSIIKCVAQDASRESQAHGSGEPRVSLAMIED